jgi:hypothetical protein
MVEVVQRGSNVIYVV